MASQAVSTSPAASASTQASTASVGSTSATRRPVERGPRSTSEDRPWSGRCLGRRRPARCAVPSPSRSPDERGAGDDHHDGGGHGHRREDGVGPATQRRGHERRAVVTSSTTAVPGRRVGRRTSTVRPSTAARRAASAPRRASASSAGSRSAQKSSWWSGIGRSRSAGCDERVGLDALVGHRAPPPRGCGAARRVPGAAGRRRCRARHRGSWPPRGGRSPRRRRARP